MIHLILLSNVLFGLLHYLLIVQVVPPLILLCQLCPNRLPLPLRLLLISLYLVIRIIIIECRCEVLFCFLELHFFLQLQDLVPWHWS